MKVLKATQHSLLARPFGLRGSQYLTLSVLLFFDLLAPDALLSEQELWKVAAGELGQTPLDVGFPKPRGEALLAGACHAPRGQRLQAERVSMSVGPLHKRLDVFGQRYWKRTGGVEHITDPLPFEAMPLTWERAFGGKDFKQNPKGQGLDPVQDADGRELRPLPCVEEPGKLVGDRSDRPQPAGFMPLEPTHPQRARLAGTYDKAWQRDVMPDFPEDFDPLFFNTAPQPQQLQEGYFRGGEEYFLENMHPDERRIRGRLPQWRVRCFLMRQRQGRSEQSFQDVGMNLDTVWLFPGALRGVLLFRGVSEVADEEYSDVQDVFVAHEPLAETPLPMAHYRRERDKALERKVDVDMKPLQRAEKKAANLMQRTRLMPKDLQAMKAKAMGQAPRMPRPPAATHAAMGSMVAGRLASLDSMESMAKGLRQRLGAGIPGRVEGSISGLRQNLQKTQKRLGEAAKKGAARREQWAAEKKAHLAQVKQTLPQERLRQAGLDTDDIEGLLEPQESSSWQRQGFAFVVASRRRLEQDPAAQRALQQLGLQRSSIKRHWLGLNPDPKVQDAASWGLPPGKGPLHLPAGLVLPVFSGKQLARLRVRPCAADGLVAGLSGAAREEVLVPRSETEPLFLPVAGGGGAAQEAPLLVVPDELQAILAEQEAGDLCSVLALASAKEKPGKQATAALLKARAVLVLLPQHAPRSAMPPWQALYKQAQPLVLPQGNTLFEARKKGVRLREWLLAALPQELRQAAGGGLTLPPEGQAPQGSPTAGMKLPGVDAKALAKQARSGMQEAMQSGRAAGGEPSAAQMTRMSLAQVAQHVGGSPERLGTLRGVSREVEAQASRLVAPGAAAPAGAAAEPAAGEMVRMSLGMMAQQAMSRGDQAGLGRLRETADEVGRLESRLDALRQKAAGLRAGAAGKKAAAGVPEETAKRLQQAGLDPETLTPLSRDEALQRLQDGRGLSRCDISGLDLSGQSLREADLRQTLCRKTNFSNADLSGADLSQAQLDGANCSGANMLEARLQRASCRKTDFSKAFLRRADFTLADLQQAVLQAADLREAVLERVICAKAKAGGAMLQGATLRMVLFVAVDCSGASFERATLHKCVFRQCTLDAAVFREARMERTMLQGCAGKATDLRKADLDHLRIVGGTRLQEADFRGVTMRQAFCKESDLARSRFRGSVLDEAVFEACSLVQCDMQGVSARRTRFAKSDLELADLLAANLFMASLRKARLVETNLRASNCFGVDFYKAVLGDTLLESANLRRTLLWQHEEGIG